jgi:hypothetical protein
MTDVKCVSRHAEDLDDGRMIAPGEVADVDLNHPHNKRLLDEGAVVLLNEEEDPGILTGKALADRAEELEIEGRSNMKADELRAAIVEKEKEGNS